MALKRKINKEAFDKLADNIKFEYAADGDDFVLQTEGDEDTGALRRANTRLKDQITTLETKNDELAGKLEKIEKNPARKQGDIDALERQFARERDEAVAAANGKLEKAQSFIKTTLLENAAQSIADKISTAPGVIRPHIERRLMVDMDGDTPVVKVLDKDGKPSALTTEKLGEEFVANKDFSSIIRVTKASGGAGSPQNNGGAVKQPGQTNVPGGENNPVDFSKMSVAEKVTYLNEKKAADQSAT